MISQRGDRPASAAVRRNNFSTSRPNGRRVKTNRDPTNGGSAARRDRWRRLGGLACATALAGEENVHVTLVDRHNYHCFQPLLYQVSTAALSPDDIAVPIRRVLSRAKNVDVVLAEVPEKAFSELVSVRGASR